jgi:hypothetical protein
MAIARYKEFGIPTQWMLDSGVVGKVLLISLRVVELMHSWIPFIVLFWIVRPLM